MAGKMSKGTIQALAGVNFKNQIQIYIYPIETLLGYNTSNEADLDNYISAWREDIKKSSAFGGGEKPQLVRRATADQSEVDIMFIEPVAKHLGFLIKAANGEQFKDITSETNKIIKRNIEIFSFANRIIRYDKIKALDFSNINYLSYSIKEFGELLEKLCFRDTSQELLKNKIQSELVIKLDECTNKDCLEWRLVRLLTSLLVIKKQTDASLIADILLDQLKFSVESEA